MTSAMRLTDENRKGINKGAKWKSVDCGTVGMNDYTKDAMRCPARP